MVNVSKAKLKSKSLEKVYSLLFEIVAYNKTEAEFNSLIQEILTPAEQIMIAKRVVILYLLVKEVPQQMIRDALKVSSATVSRYALMLRFADTEIQKQIKAVLGKEQIIHLLEDVFFNLLVQPGIKRGDWSKYWNYQKVKSSRTTSTL